MDVISYALSKKIAEHAVSGVQSMSVSGQTLTINTKDSGVLTMTFPTPKDGVSVTDIDVNANNQIVFTMSDGTEFISGKIPTVKGDKGDPFKYSDFTPEQLDALKGEDGFSPTATVEKVGKIATITITDKNGTTTATIKDGEGSEGGEANVIDSISVNGTPISPDENKNVDITVPSIEGLTKDADLSTVAKSGSYEDLSNKPEIPSVEGLAKTTDIPTKVSQLENDSNYLSSIPEEYVTDTELEAKGYLTEHQDISGKVDKVEGKSLISDTEIERLASVDNYDDTLVKSQIQAVANGLMDSVGYSADYKTIDIIAKNGVKKSVNVAPIISHASITELSDVDTTNKATGKALVYNATTSKHEYADVSGTDEKVKMDASTDAKYLGELLDNVTIINENGELKVKKLDGQEVTITEINYLKGLTMNVMDLVNMFSNGGVKIINTPVATYAELLTIDKSSFIEGISYLVYVLADENHDNAKTTYLVDKDSETPTYFGFADSQRDFTTNPIDLATEITGKLGISNMDSDAIKALFTVDDTYKTETATNNAFSTHGAKALYDELLLAIGNKANDSDLTAHKDDTDIHVSTEDRANWDSAKTHADSAHAPSDAQENIIESVKVNNQEITPDENKAVNIDLSDYAKKTDIPTTLPANGGNADTVNNHTVKSDVPENAVFTDTIYDDTEVKGSIEEVNSNLDELKFSEISGGKNLFQTKNVGFYTTNGKINKNDDYVCSDIVEWNGGTTVYISTDKAYPTLNSNKGVWVGCVCFDVNGDFISDSYIGTYMGSDLKKTLPIVSSNAKYVGLSVDKDVNVCFSITEIDYEPYIPSVKMLAEENEQQSSDLDGLGYGENGAKNLFKNYDVMKSYTISSETYNGYPIIYSDQKWEGAYQSDLILKSGVTYTLSAYVKGNGWAYVFSSSKDGYIGGKKIALTDNFERFSLVYTPNEDVSQIRIENDGSELYITCFQIEEGDTVTPYKPYIPSVKMLAEEVSAQNESLSVIGKCKNLLNPTLETTTVSGVTCTNNGDGTYTLNGTATQNTDFTFFDNLEKYQHLKNRTVKLVGCPKGGSDTTYRLMLQLQQSPWPSAIDIGKGSSVTVDNNDNWACWIRIYKDATVSNLTFKPMLVNLDEHPELSNITYDDFVPYTGDGETLTHDVAELKNDLVPKKIELQNVDERVTIQDNGSFIINGFAFVNLLVTFNETIEQWTNFVRLPRPKVDRISVHCENSVKLTIYNQDNLPGDCGTYDIVQSGTEIRLLANYEVA